MKKYYFILLMSLLFSFTAKGQEINDLDDAGSRGCKGENVMFGGNQYLCNSLTWKLVFEENFNGNTLDLNKWRSITGVPRDETLSIQKAWHKPENVEVSNGLLKIVSKRETMLHMPVVTSWDPYTIAYVDFDYTTGEIETNAKFFQGKLTARIKIPKGWGLWPAFWMFGNPPYSEIDVFEFRNNGDHSLLSKVHETCVHDNGAWCPSYYVGSDFSTDFHIFTMIWDEYDISFYVDGVLKRSHVHYYNASTGQESGCTLYAYQTYVQMPYPDAPMSIILNTAIQHNDGNDPDRTTPFPSQMEIDYVRFYQQTPCYNESIPITDPTTIRNFKDGAFNSVVGTTLKMGDGFTLNNNQQLSARASDKIVLQAGFTAKAGCNFTAVIDPSACSSSKEMGDEIDEDEGAEIIPKRMVQEEDVMTDNIRVFPNPAQDKLFIEMPYHYGKSVRYKIQMLNAQGTILHTFVTEECKIGMDMNNYPQGLYLLNITNMETGETSNHKIIRQ